LLRCCEGGIGRCLPVRSSVRSRLGTRNGQDTPQPSPHPYVRRPPLRLFALRPVRGPAPRASHTDLFGYGFALQKGPGPSRAVVTCLTKQSTGPLCPAMQKVSTLKAICLARRPAAAYQTGCPIRRGEAVVVREEWSGTTKSPPPVEFVTDEATTRCLPDPCVGVGCGVVCGLWRGGVLPHLLFWFWESHTGLLLPRARLPRCRVATSAADRSQIFCTRRKTQQQNDGGKHTADLKLRGIIPPVSLRISNGRHATPPVFFFFFNPKTSTAPNSQMRVKQLARHVPLASSVSV
jgi:hypothetical protein